jgi:hypothetical protein
LSTDSSGVPLEFRGRVSAKQSKTAFLPDKNGVLSKKE